MKSREIKTAKDFDELFAEMRASTEAADRAMAPEQEALKPGDFYTREFDGLSIWGEIVESEYPEDRAYLAKTPNRRMVRAYSVVCPDGELGTEHISCMWPITKEVFEAARKAGWADEKDAFKSYSDRFWKKVRKTKVGGTG